MICAITISSPTSGPDEPLIQGVGGKEREGGEMLFLLNNLRLLRPLSLNNFPEILILPPCVTPPLCPTHRKRRSKSTALPLVLRP